MNRHRVFLACATCAALLLGVRPLLADEGMWTFDNLPLKQLKAKYNFEPTKQWLEHVRACAVRFNSGGSGSFVSADGLVMTNHHVGADMLQKISTKDKDYYKDGFYAKTRADEVRAPDLELNVLAGIEDVTDQVNAGVKSEMSDAEAAKSRRQAIATIEKASLDKTGMRSDVVTLYQGGRYALYTFKTYTDVRLVFAPEFDIAFFGGDPDNFEYPRYDLDVTFFRAYENGKPAKVEHYLKWSPNGSKDGDLVFVAGHPGRTNRLNTAAHLESLRDVGYPYVLEVLKDLEAFLLEYSARGPEQARQAKEDLFGVQNSRKARIGGLGGLMNTEFMARKHASESELRKKIASDPEMAAKYGPAWDKIAAARKVAIDLTKTTGAKEGGRGFHSELFRIARTLVRLAEENNKPNPDRLREFQEGGRKSLELALYSDAPIYPEFEKAKIAHAIAFWQKKLPDDPTLKLVLDGRSAKETADALVDGTKLADVAVRKKLAEGGSAAIAQSNDPMIKLALALDPESRALRKRLEDEIDGVQTSQYALIAKAVFAAEGDKVYPDATFTLRLAFGTVKGYEQDGKFIEPFTTIGGAFAHSQAHGGKPPYELPESWHKAKKDGRLKLDTPMNFVSTADIIGGNSGSPVINREGEVVGLIFDGNIQSLVLDFGYDDVQARAVSVDSRAIAEALRSVYPVPDLVKELTAK